jgi:mono/diheme cytochrome c family protein
MPAWRAVYGDEEIWDIVAFIERMPTMSPNEYQALQPPPVRELRKHGPSGLTNATPMS